MITYCLTPIFPRFNILFIKLSITLHTNIQIHFQSDFVPWFKVVNTNYLYSYNTRYLIFAFRFSSCYFWIFEIASWTEITKPKYGGGGGGLKDTALHFQGIPATHITLHEAFHRQTVCVDLSLQTQGVPISAYPQENLQQLHNLHVRQSHIPYPQSKWYFVCQISNLWSSAREKLYQNYTKNVTVFYSLSSYIF